MNRLSFLLLTILIGVIASFAFVQQDQTRIAFVDSQAAIRAHPAGAEAKALEEQAKVEIEALQTDLQALVTKANSGEQLTPDEQNRFQNLRSTIATVQKNYADQIGAAVGPALEAVDKAISEIAAENDYAAIFDARVAGQEGTNLVVYAKKDLNITQLVIDRMNASQ
ncbi:MAG: OmpH family outer membrane protein [Trueperaceae bacterium]|nr:OmpH family outer membrane protein [Trueperaceae bacterium]